MVIFPLLALLATAVNGHLIFFTREANSQCPPENGQYSHPQHCDKFLNCWDGKAIEGQCSHGLYFNPKTSSCDYPRNVDCMGKSDSRPTENDPNCPEAYGTFTGSYCNEFIVCHAGNGTVYRCPDMYSYDKETGTCVSDPTCQAQVVADVPNDPHIPPTQVINPEEIKPLPPNGPDEDDNIFIPVLPSVPQTRCPIRTGFVPIDDCHKVLVCVGGSGYEVDCGKDFFHPSAGKCMSERSPLCPTPEPPVLQYLALPQFYIFKK